MMPRLFAPFVVTIVFCLGYAITVWAYNVAVFPVLDLTKDSNGVNFEITNGLFHGIGSLGVDLVPEKSIISFMARHRIRVLGRLTIQDIRRCREELGTDLILMATLCEYGQGANGVSIGMVLQLVRTADAKVIWSMVRDLTEQDFTHILGISESGGLGDLAERLIGEIVENWPQEIDVTAEEEEAIEFEAARIFPRYVRPGRMVTCSIKPRERSMGEKLPTMRLKVDGGQVFPLEEDKDFPGVFKAMWKAPNQDGRYAVVLVSRWPSGYQERKLIGSYYVDSKPPILELTFKNVILEDIPTFNERLVVIPKMKEPEPTRFWRFSVVSEATNATILDYDGAGQLPKRLYWHARNSDGSAVDDGIYVVTLRVWDRAGNVAVAKKRVRVRRMPPEVEIQLKKKRDDIMMSLIEKKGLPIAFWWVRVSFANGKIVAEDDGDKLPVEIRLAPEKALSGKNLLATITVTDIVGNEFRRRIPNLLDLLPEKKQEEDQKGLIKEWIEEF